MKIIYKLLVVSFKYGLVGLILFLNTTHAEIFKWVDEDGKIHYSDRKVHKQAEKIDIDTGVKASDQSPENPELRLTRQKKYLNYLQSERLERQEKRDEAKIEEDNKKKFCSRLEDQLNAYVQGNRRWYVLDELTGERNYISDDQIEVEKAELRSEIESNCS